MKRIALFLLCLLFLDFRARGWIMPTDAEIEMRLKQLNKPAVKTVLSKYGQTIDCVDIYKQPAFDNPLLKNHTIEFKPSFYPLAPNFTLEIENQLFETCPEGTIPIRRISKEELIRRIQYGYIGNDLNVNNDLVPIVEYAEASYAKEGSGQPGVTGWAGVAGLVNTWKPFVLHGESTHTAIGMRSIYDTEKWLKVGYVINSLAFGDFEPHFFIAIRNGGQYRACVNLECPAFVQLDPTIVLGQVITTVSEIDGPQWEFLAQIYKDNVQKKWWLRVASSTLGYFPFEVFPGVEKELLAVWGGALTNRWPLRKHTVSQMGSGRQAQEGFKKAAYINGMSVYGDDLKPQPAANLYLFSTFPRCYNALQGRNQEEPPLVHVHIFFGGSGGEGCEKTHG